MQRRRIYEEVCAVEGCTACPKNELQHYSLYFTAHTAVKTSSKEERWNHMIGSPLAFEIWKLTPIS